MPTERQRRAAERRRLRRQQRRRAQREAQRRRFALIASVVGVLVVAAVVTTVVIFTGNDKSTPTAAGTTALPPTPTSPASSSPAASYPCTWTAGGTAARHVAQPATTRPPRTGSVTVSVQTTRGPMTFQLDRAAAPCTVASFVSLVRQHYYDATPCHRLTTAGIYVLQCGDPSGTGTGGPGYTIPDEAKGSESYPAGTIAMARTSQPHSGGSQFFIVYKNSPNLQQRLGTLQYTVFGRVTSGLSVVDQVAAKGSDNSNGTGDGKPKLPISLTKLRVVR
jgi:peptidyl-prolyl cis-trans isomerase B (cyclophilin B)